MSRRQPSAVFLRVRMVRPRGAFALLAGLLLLLPLLSACGAAQEADDRPLVVTSVPVIYSLTANLTGDDFRLENLLPPGASPHYVSLTPAQAMLVSDADLVVVNGAGLEGWLDDLVVTAGAEDLPVAVASRGVTFLRPDEPLPVPDGEEDDHDEPEDVDPHVWLDAQNAQVMVRNIADALIELNPDAAMRIEERARTYQDRLQEIDDEVRGRLAETEHKDFVSFHSAFQYYARAYGLRQVAVIQPFPGREPSPRYLAGIVDLVRELDVQAVFSEPQFSPRPAESLARETGARLYEVDPEGSVIAAEMYEDLMRDNTDTFVEALGGGS
jgi:manganese/iron transport system substrate-binding protein